MAPVRTNAAKPPMIANEISSSISDAARRRGLGMAAIVPRRTNKMQESDLVPAALFSTGGALVRCPPKATNRRISVTLGECALDNCAHFFVAGQKLVVGTR